ncbi:ash family protein [Escherichia coli]|uniref:ash family protein n=1 Tax=Escherichia coli TaxID=562 RepID=UPI001986F7B0|nr:ash family protein [Escherichia coli]HAN5845021.1 ash family protein [Escherichia coli]
MSALVLCGNSGVILLSVKDHQHIDSAIPGRYTVQAPYKTGAGIGVLKLITEHNRAHAVFSCHEHCYAQIMVGRTGPTSVGPGSVVSGNANPVRLTTSVIGVPCGEFSKKLTTGAVTMTTLPTLSRLNDEDLHKLSYVTTALRALRKVTLSDPQAHQVLVETLLNLQAERIRLADKANLHIHRLLNISGGHRHA